MIAALKGMKRHHQHSANSTAPDPLVKMAADLASAVEENEKTQRRFRIAVTIRLSKIATTVQMLHAAQILQARPSHLQTDEKLREDCKSAEEFIATRSKAMVRKMVKFIYDDSEVPAGPAGGSRKWSGWEI